MTRLRPGVKTQRGSEVPDWDAADALTIERCCVQPTTTSLDQDGRVLGIMDGVTCYMPASADVQAGDRIVYNGETYVINGDPRRWSSPTGNLSHVMLNLRRWEG